jgi:hypothetical protein
MWTQRDYWFPYESPLLVSSLVDSIPVTILFAAQPVSPVVWGRVSRSSKVGTIL